MVKLQELGLGLGTAVGDWDWEWAMGLENGEYPQSLEMTA